MPGTSKLERGEIEPLTFSQFCEALNKVMDIDMERVTAITITARIGRSVNVNVDYLGTDDMCAVFEILKDDPNDG